MITFILVSVAFIAGILVGANTTISIDIKKTTKIDEEKDERIQRKQK